MRERGRLASFAAGLTVLSMHAATWFNTIINPQQTFAKERHRHHGITTCPANLIRRFPWLLLWLGAILSSCGIDGLGPRGVAARPAASRRPSGGYSAICIIGKNENEYADEWVNYHRCLGVSHIYLYDHDSVKPMQSAVSRHIKDGFLTYIPWGGEHTKWTKGNHSADLAHFMQTAQGRAYNHCLEAWGPRHRFIGFLDFDEYLVFHKKTLRSLNHLLRQYEQHGALSLYWTLLGTSGHATRPSGGVVDSYTQCVPSEGRENTQFKTFVNTKYLPIMYSPHRVTFQINITTAVDENHKDIAQGRHERGSHEIASVYHYVTRSKEEFKVKSRRGGGAGVTRFLAFMKNVDRACTATCKGAIETRRRCRRRAAKLKG